MHENVSYIREKHERQKIRWENYYRNILLKKEIYERECISKRVESRKKEK